MYKLKLSCCGQATATPSTADPPLRGAAKRKLNERFVCARERLVAAAPVLCSELEKAVLVVALKSII